MLIKSKLTKFAAFIGLAAVHACGSAQVQAPPPSADSPPVLAAIANLRKAAMASDPALPGLGWLVGTWATRDLGPLVLEMWQPARGGVMLGLGHTIKGGHTVGAEVQRIVAGPPVALVALPDGAGQPTVFRLVENAANTASFADAGHDFPQQIRYVRAGSALTVTLTGVDKDQPRTIIYTMRCIDGPCVER